MRVAGIRVLGGRVEPLVLPDPPEPASGEVLIGVLAAGIGNWDDLVRAGSWDVGIRPPMALGVEAAGIVRAIGPGVTRFAVGEAVLVHSAPLRYQGSWAEQYLAKEADMATKPASLDWRLAGALPVPLLTAAQAVALVAGPRSAEVLVHGASGVTGGLLVAMAVGRGFRVVATSSQASAAHVRAYGAMEVIDYHLPDWRQQLGESRRGRFMAVLNAVRDEAESLMPLVADGGQLVTITGDPPAPDRGIAVTNAYVRPDGAMLEDAARVFARQQPTIPVAEAVALSDAGGALERVVQRAGGGIRVVEPGA